MCERDRRGGENFPQVQRTAEELACSLGPLARRFWTPQARREVTELVRTVIDAVLLCGPTAARISSSPGSCVAVPADDPASFPHGAINPDAVITYWHHTFGAPAMQLEASDYAATTSDWHMLKHLFIDVLAPVKLSHLPTSANLRDLHVYLSTPLQIIQLRSWNSDERTFLATNLRWLRTQTTPHTTGNDDLYATELGFNYGDPQRPRHNTNHKPAPRTSPRNPPPTTSSC
jgi:hypothetical protein